MKTPATTDPTRYRVTFERVGVALSASVGNLIDSYVFLVLAFPAFWHSLYAGNVVGKFEMIAVGVALTVARRRFAPVAA